MLCNAMLTVLLKMSQSGCDFIIVKLLHAGLPVYDENQASAVAADGDAGRVRQYSQVTSPSKMSRIDTLLIEIPDLSPKRFIFDPLSGTNPSSDRSLADQEMKKKLLISLSNILRSSTRA